MAGGVDQIDQETFGVFLQGLFDKRQILVLHLEVHGNSAEKLKLEDEKNLLKHIFDRNIKLTWI